MTIDIAAIKARAEKVPAILVTHRSPWYVSMDGVKDANQCWMFKGSGSLDRQIAELANYASTARTDIPALIAVLEASEAARVKAEQERDTAREELSAANQTLVSISVKLDGPDEWSEQSMMLASIEMMIGDRITALEAERDALKEALRQCISPIGGYAIKDSDQALEVVSGFLTQICRTSDIARRALESSHE